MWRFAKMLFFFSRSPMQLRSYATLHDYGLKFSGLVTTAVGSADLRHYGYGIARAWAGTRFANECEPFDIINITRAHCLPSFPSHPPCPHRTLYTVEHCRQRGPHCWLPQSSASLHGPPAASRGSVASFSPSTPPRSPPGFPNWRPSLSLVPTAPSLRWWAGSRSARTPSGGLG